MFLRHWLLSLSALFIFSFSSAQNKAAIYVVAHPDDWQLFMGNDAYSDIQDTSNRVIFILTTSGDATANRPKANLRLARSRERGVLNSVRFSADMKTVVDSACQTRHVTINGHDMLCYPYKHVRTYFLRLPDGCFSSGYMGQSLEYLHDGRIDRITALDSSTTYEGWHDLVHTIRAIMEKETAGYSNITLSYQDHDKTINLRDHPDHTFSGLAAAQAGATLPLLQHTGYLDYCIVDKPANIGAEDIAVKAAVFALADFGITEQGDGSSFNRAHLAFLTRTYSRKLPMVDSAGNPNFSNRITIYPNPASGSTVQIRYTLSAPEVIQLTLTDINGNSRWSNVNIPSLTGDNEYTIPLTGIAPGIYFVSLHTAAGTELVKLIRF
ncbi:T9SS type A sorting domain-containing protein [Taibaiella koreensis]|uniref:T9SS type A sorting domain-containing protein n=1 Tax=Taibaiella koreensis TaxID=1268548 RepID=UPI000E59BEAF|nr:T9SS type A sorting domain-containing protein [Taibaiella koreensis]